MGKESMGKLIATRLVLGAALDRLSIEQLRGLYDLESASLDGLIQLRSSRGTLSELQEQILNEQKRIIFRIGQRIHALETGDPGPDPTYGDPHFYCIECSMPVPFLGLGQEMACPTCGSAEFIETLR